MKIYTKKGDKGTTSNVIGMSLSKADIFMELQGGIDEINANVGHLRSIIKDSKIKEANYIDEKLKKIQFILYKTGVDVSSQFRYQHISDEDVKFIEIEIDYMTEKMPILNSFIHYSGSASSTYSHVIRTIIRRVERVFVRVLEGMEYPVDYQFINRLSDYFFTLARYINFLEGIGDEAMNMN
ncbi:Cob(I)yrinic acid a,c-diamide adenosyltransferase [Caloramator mitchellensis]|uniref:Corrinoid adenosyltransferase n=1 Tax=Caloramator mitchellensis TaxID=908809 RepID=A0A0R3K0J8_CALMK|nr:cob(I)yrinic acid a,c-diamide adenosyltransferase [Caloramator mitchellensis]KRQ86386.1 Cob(I)yrinic acid a,c-diamide adenosyltransferase [Caloramator mitchellensis]